MAKAEHTPGPWTFDLDVVDDGDINVFRDGPPSEGIPGRPICAVDVRLVPDQAELPSREEALANARLIASAPELLEALRRVRAAFEEPKQDIEGEHNAIQAAYKHTCWAIAKAEGRAEAEERR